MRIGFTGTRKGMTAKQRTRLAEELSDWRGHKFHHGDCVGADEQAHQIASKAGLVVIIHPPRNDALRAYCAAAEIRQPLEYLERNHRIVDDTDFLIAAPEGQEERLRSGTWSTVRYADEKHRPLVILWPNGDVERRLP